MCSNKQNVAIKVPLIWLFTVPMGHHSSPQFMNSHYMVSKRPKGSLPLDIGNCHMCTTRDMEVDHFMESHKECQCRIRTLDHRASLHVPPPGLEYLCNVDQLLVKQEIEVLEVLTGWETANRYKVQNSLGQQVYFASEESNIISMQCCGASRDFIMHITDNVGQEVIRVSRKFKCCVCRCPWCACHDTCAHMVQVEVPVGHIIGYVKKRQSCIRPYYILTDGDHEEVLSVSGTPCCYTGWIGDQNFVVNSRDGHTQVGKVSKKWSGLVKEYFTDADNFGISFPMDLDVKMKAVMLGVVFLIDFMYYESTEPLFSSSSSSGSNRTSM